MSTLSHRQELQRRDLGTLHDSLGEMLRARMKDLSVTDIMLNGNGSLFEKREGVGLVKLGTLNEHSARTIVNLIAAMADTIIDRKNPVVEAELPIRNGRFIGYVPPYVEKPGFTIRLPPSKLYTLADYVKSGIATPRQAEILATAVRKKWNILVAGGTGSGKSTLLNALLEALYRVHPAMRLGLIEEIIELQYLQENVLALRTGPAVNHQTMLKYLMRSRPEGIIVGEVRDGAALQLIKACNTGHEPVMSTIHANTPVRALGRLEDLCAEAIPGVSFRNQIADAMHIVVGIAHVDAEDREPGEPERRITEIIKVEGTSNENYNTVTLA